MRCGAFHRVEGTLCLVRHGQAALSGSKTKAPGSAGGYLLSNSPTDLQSALGAIAERQGRWPPPTRRGGPLSSSSWIARTSIGMRSSSRSFPSLALLHFPAPRPHPEQEFRSCLGREWPPPHPPPRTTRSSMASTPIAGQTPRQGTSMGSGDRQLCEAPAAQGVRAASS